MKLFKIGEKTEKFLASAFATAIPNAIRCQWRDKYGAPNTPANSHRHTISFLIYDTLLKRYTYKWNMVILEKSPHFCYLVLLKLLILLICSLDVCSYIRSPDGQTHRSTVTLASHVCQKEVYYICYFHTGKQRVRQFLRVPSPKSRKSPNQELLVAME